jgi:hypothetical protein
MNTVSLIALSTPIIVVLAGLVALVRAAKNAPEGYEDEHGFHAGSEPARVADILDLSIDGYATAPAGSPYTTSSAVRRPQLPQLSDGQVDCTWNWPEASRRPGRTVLRAPRPDGREMR